MSGTSRVSNLKQLAFNAIPSELRDIIHDKEQTNEDLEKIRGIIRDNNLFLDSKNTILEIRKGTKSSLLITDLSNNDINALLKMNLFMSSEQKNTVVFDSYEKDVLIIYKFRETIQKIDDDNIELTDVPYKLLLIYNTFLILYGLRNNNNQYFKDFFLNTSNRFNSFNPINYLNYFDKNNKSNDKDGSIIINILEYIDTQEKQKKQEEQKEQEEQLKKRTMLLLKEITTKKGGHSLNLPNLPKQKISQKPRAKTLSQKHTLSDKKNTKSIYKQYLINEKKKFEKILNKEFNKKYNEYYYICEQIKKININNIYLPFLIYFLLRKYLTYDYLSGVGI